MADTFSPLLNLRLQQTGNNQNTWGDLLNSDTITPIENAIAGRASHAVTGGTLDLSAAPLVEKVHIFTGTLTADQTVIIPNISKAMKIWNITSGSFFLLVKTSAGTAVCIPQGTIKDVYCDAGNSVLRADKDDVGEVKYFARTTAPSGFFACDGSAKIRASVPDLFAAISTTWGAGNGATTFNIPDLQTGNRFLRASGGSLAVGTVQTSQNLAHTHGGSSASTSLSLVINPAGFHNHTGTTGTESAFRTHPTSTGANSGLTIASGFGGSGVQVVNNATAATNAQSSFHTHDVTVSAQADHSHGTSGSSASTSLSIASDGGSEARPNNVAALACIRY